MRMVVIYRSERKKILHSQLRLVDWLYSVIERAEHTLIGPIASMSTDKSAKFNE